MNRRGGQNKSKRKGLKKSAILFSSDCDYNAPEYIAEVEKAIKARHASMEKIVPKDDDRQDHEELEDAKKPVDPTPPPSPALDENNNPNLENQNTFGKNVKNNVNKVNGVKKVNNFSSFKLSPELENMMERISRRNAKVYDFWKKRKLLPKLNKP